MRYLAGVLYPVLLQAFILFLIIDMNTGNGSWVGLLAYIVGMFSLPATAIVNAIYIKSNKEMANFRLISRCFIFGLIGPVIIAPLLFLM